MAEPRHQETGARESRGAGSSAHPYPHLNEEALLRQLEDRWSAEGGFDQRNADTFGTDTANRFNEWQPGAQETDLHLGSIPDGAVRHLQDRIGREIRSHMAAEERGTTSDLSCARSWNQSASLSFVSMSKRQPACPTAATSIRLGVSSSAHSCGLRERLTPVTPNPWQRVTFHRGTLGPPRGLRCRGSNISGTKNPSTTDNRLSDATSAKTNQGRARAAAYTA